MIRALVVATLALLVLAGVGAGSALAPRTAKVTLTDSAIRPVRARVATGGKVTWTNRGKRPHVVVSDTNKWRPFTLRRGRRKTVAFEKAGRYCYRVDGRRKGAVLVGKAPAKCSQPGGGGGSGVTTKTVRFDVRIEALLDQTETFTSNAPESTGTLHLRLTWTGVWQRVTVKIQRSGTNVVVVMTAPARGTITAQLLFDETRSSIGPCTGTVDFPAYDGDLLLQGSRNTGSETYSGMDASLTPPAFTLFDELAFGRQRGACRDNVLGLPHWQAGGVVTPEGVDIHHPPGLSIHPVDTRWSRTTPGGSSLPFPLNRIVNGQGFTIETGPRHAELSQEGYHLGFDGSARYVFSPRS